VWGRVKCEVAVQIFKLSYSGHYSISHVAFVALKQVCDTLTICMTVPRVSDYYCNNVLVQLSHHMFLYGTEEDQLVETGLPLLESNFVKNTSVNTGRTCCAKKNKTFH